MAEASIPNPQVVRALLFDLGGVVIGFDFRRAFQFWASRAGCNPKVLEERFSLDEAYEQHERGEIGASDYFGALRTSLGISISDEDFIEGWNDVYLGPVPEMARLLSTASQRLPAYAFTNSNPTHQSVWSVRYAEELKWFQSIFVSSEIGLRKPDPDAFRLVASRMGFQPQHVLFFDDASDNVDGARTAGMQGVVVTSSDDVIMAFSQIGLG